MMIKRLLDRLRGARRIELFAALALAALLALMMLDIGRSGDSEPRTELESRVERILGRVEGAGRVSVMISQEGDGDVTGVVIVAEGLSDVQTYLRLQRAVSALLNVDVGKIEIIAADPLEGNMNKTVRIALAAFTLAALMTADTLVTMALVKRRENRAASAPAYSTVLDDPMARFRLEREQLRARQEAQLNDIIHAGDGDEENAARARGQLLDMLDHARTESNLEGILQSRGFEEALVSVSDTAANVLIRGQTPTLGESAVILDLVMRETGLTGGNVKIIPVK